MLPRPDRMRSIAVRGLQCFDTSAIPIPGFV
jgi:hypothetical protein